MEATQTAEDRELEYELIIDTSTNSHTDLVQQVAEAAAAEALKSYENGEHGDLLLNAGRAALIATNAALRTLDAEGFLLPEGERTQKWVVMSRENLPMTLPLDAEGLRLHMAEKGLAATEHVDTIITVVCPVDRDATLPHPYAQNVPSTEAEF